MDNKIIEIFKDILISCELPTSISDINNLPSKFSNSSNINNLPFNSHNEFKDMYNYKRTLGIFINFDDKILRFISNKFEYFVANLIASTWMVCALSCIVLFFITFKWVLLLGILTSFIGSMLSSPIPFGKIRFHILSFSGSVFFIALFLLDWQWACIIGSFWLSVFSLISTRWLFNKKIINIIMQSEIILCYLYIYQVLTFKDMSNNKIFKY